MSDQSPLPGPPPSRPRDPTADDEYYAPVDGEAFPPTHRPPRRPTTPWIALGIVASLFVGCTALVVAARDDEPEEVDTSQNVAANDAEAHDPTEAEAPSDAVEVTAGEWEVLGGIDALQPEADGLGDYTLSFEILNTGEVARSGVFTVNVLEGDVLLGSIDCYTGEVQPGEVGIADCLSTDEYKSGWTEIEIIMNTS
jgi:hypothetical protein